MKKIFIFFIFLFALKIADAQYLANDSLSRLINVKALDLIAKYEDCLKFNKPIKRKNFSSFFHSSARMMNDVMPENTLQDKILPSEYIQLINKYYADTGVKHLVLNTYDISAVTVEDEYASLSMLVKKYTETVTRQNVQYIDTFYQKYEIIYLFSTNECKIYDISTAEKREKYIQIYPQYKGIFKTTPLPNDTILISGKVFPVNKEGYVLLKNINISNEFLFQPYKKPVYYKTYRVPDNIPIRKNKFDKKDKNIVKINFWNWMAYADFRYHFIFNGESPVKLESDTFGINIMNNGSFSNYLMLNLVRRVSEKGYWSIKIGGGADVYTYTSYLLNNVSTYPAVDPDGDPYLRINRVYNIKEKHNLTYLTAPFVVEKGFTFGRNSFYANVSYYLMLNYAATYNQDAEALYAGYYDYLFNLVIQENGVYDFGAYQFEIRNQPLVVDRMVMAYGFGLGYCRQITRKTYIDLAFNYRKSLGYLFLENKLNLSDTYTSINTLNNLNNKYALNYMNISLGLSIKL